MKGSDLEHSQQIVRLIEVGTASRSDVVALFMYLREQLDDRDPVKDIAHCIAHSKRDRGTAFRYIEAFIDSFITWAQNGGTLAVERLFLLEDVIEHLLQDLVAQGLNVQPEAVRQQSLLLRTHLGDILDGVEIRLPHPNVVDCTFHTASMSPNPPSFVVRWQGLEAARVIQIPANVATAFPVFE